MAYFPIWYIVWIFVAALVLLMTAFSIYKAHMRHKRRITVNYPTRTNVQVTTCTTNVSNTPANPAPPPLSNPVYPPSYPPSYPPPYPPPAYQAPYPPTGPPNVPAPPYPGPPQGQPWQSQMTKSSLPTISYGESATLPGSFS